MVFGELGGSNYPGIGVSCGSRLCNVCLAVLFVPVISFSVDKAGDFTDARATVATGDLSTRTRVFKEQWFQFNGLTHDRVRNALTVSYDEVITALVRAVNDHVSAAHRLPKLDQAIPLVLSGGTASPQGFLEYFSKVMHSQKFPLKISEVRVSRATKG